MNIPQFPSHDLAKLVLGYLAEEQLMTAYDEFLQASPYLDALKNEYDRIFMTSLKNILAEYRAVKIYVETCKPIALRRKLFQCTNLLDTVKLLVSYIDLNKLQTQATTERNGFNKQNTSTTPKSNQCEVCNSLQLQECICKGRNKVNNVSASSVESNALESSVETTLLTDLPGNHVTTRKKNVKVLEKDSTCFLSSSSSSCVSQELHVKHSDYINSEENIQSNTISLDANNIGINDLAHHTSKVLSMEPLQVQPNIFTPNIHASSSVGIIHSRSSTEISKTVFDEICGTSPLGDFALGVKGGDNGINNVPEFRTDLLNIPLATKELNIEPRPLSLNDTNKCQYLLKVGNVTNTLGGPFTNISSKEENSQLVNIKPKSEERKIKILSDVKFGRTKQVPSSNATSTPLTQMKTIVINGTPAYRHKSMGIPQNFTKDEIMAMPTIIVVPSAGSVKKKSQVRTNTKKSILSNTTPTAACNTVTTSSTTPLLGPLVIDVSCTSAPAKGPNSPCLDTQPQPGLIKTVDVTKTASMPKDSICNILESSTPQIVPPTRKSSSTPRRTSHIRVLDFSTPRRILHETIQEKAESQNGDAPVEVVLSSSPNVAALDLAKSDTISSGEKCVKEVYSNSNDNQNESAKENSDENNKVKVKKQSWDADLRAVLSGHDINMSSKSISKLKSKTNKRRKSMNMSKSTGDEVDGSKIRELKNKETPRTRRSKRKVQCDEEDIDCVMVSTETVQPNIKPTINIISKPNWGSLSNEVIHKDEEEKQTDNNIEEHAETPETDRVCLQNIIGAKLNISDLLETPYKQALYDIQMETPKFLGSDLPDYPMSDIKIMNIPTPRFLNTPNPPQPTPSSYSSYPTDYSSGGSYYKPDEQDYAPAPDLSSKISPTKEEIVTKSQKQGDQSTKKVTARPVRQCTKNISYYKHIMNSNKSKDIDDNLSVSSCSESANAHISLENSVIEKTSKAANSSKHMEVKKSATKKRSSTSRKRKSPSKKIKSNTFMKIKPRRPTPVKESKNKSYTSKSPFKYQIKKRNSIKDKRVSATPPTVSAPTKSRRKSSTPRKINCTKTCNSESDGHDSPETSNNKYTEPPEAGIVNNPDSDTEHIALRWSDDGSQDSKGNEKPNKHTISESDEISKIQEYIETTSVKLPNDYIKDCDKISLQADLIKRGFDVETAKSIERDLLDTPPHCNNKSLNLTLPELNVTKDNEDVRETIVSVGNSQILNGSEEVEDDDDVEEVELSVHDCNEESKNFLSMVFNDTADAVKKPDIKLKDKFSMEICIDDGVAIRLRATALTELFDQNPGCLEELNYSYRETVVAVNSISNIDKLYTPIKDSVRAQCYEIFDSTLTSIDTPLKVHSPRAQGSVATSSNFVMEIMLEEEQADFSENTEINDNSQKPEPKKRKRRQSGNSSEESSHENTNKKAKSEEQYLLNTANIQNMDIETVLTKLHGP